MPRPPRRRAATAREARQPRTPDRRAAEARRPRKGGEAPRLIALNMVLNGSSREEVARYLDENFDLEDPGELLDEVWTRANGLSPRLAETARRT